MEPTSKRWKTWMEPRYQERANVLATLPEPMQEARPKYILWVWGGKTLLDGEMIGLADLKFVDGPNSFNIAVETIDEAMALASRITGCYGLGLVELEDDGEYREWYDECGVDIEELSR